MKFEATVSYILQNKESRQCSFGQKERQIGALVCISEIRDRARLRVRVRIRVKMMTRIHPKPQEMHREGIVVSMECGPKPCSTDHVAGHAV